jgi:methylthioribose-1-phosphate isomerase
MPSFMAPLISIKSSDDKLEIVNQLLLPHTTQFIQINTIEDAHDAIKTMKVGSDRLNPILTYQ